MQRTPREDRLFYYSLVPSAYLILGALILLIAVITWKSIPALREYGIDLYTTNEWRPSENKPGEYGLLAAIYGTLASTVIAVAIALPLSISLAVTIEELAPRKIREALIFVSDVAAGFPTVVFGLWGIDILIPFLRDRVMAPLHEGLGFIPLFSCRPLSGASLLAAGILLAFMITPFMSALVREAYRMIPVHLKEAAVSLSAAWYQYIRLMLGMIRPAILAALLLGFGRAAGETVAVSLVVGNSFSLTACMFAPAYTISALIANQFGNAAYYPLMPEVLFAGSLLLILIGLVLNQLGISLMERVRSLAD
ncbi:MAG: phosphate ABC transporter permease subunit PstC [Desulfurococcales archaeon]|nr:phosphate ABC transporter permease subunit PstC [Desulfurococcales archaeon]